MGSVTKALLGLVLGCIALVALTLTFSFLKQRIGGSDKKSHVSVIDLNGVIYSSNSFIKNLKEELEKPTVKAIVVRINSPGGVVGPSQEMYEAIKKANEKVPVVMAMGSLAASGGYYVALGGRQIWANPGTLTGSIGVIMEFVNAEKLYEWAKLERYTLKAGKLKDVGSPFRKMTLEERQFLETMLLDIHSQFKAAVKERRKLSDEEVAKYTDGRIMTGSQAKAAKLVDELGGVEDAILSAKKLAGLPEDAFVHYPTVKKGLLKEALFGDGGEAEGILRGIRGLLEVSQPGWRVLMLAPLASDPLAG